jgi:citrate lyase subunit beta/citryl-CoA lyase
MPVMDIQRSFMFVPGSSEKMLTKAMGLDNLDVAMFDLEDGVPPSLKDDARELVATMLSKPPGGPARFVRLNAIATERMEADLQSVVVPGLEGVVLPKVETAADVELVDRELSAREQRAGLAPGSVRVIASIESAGGLLNAPSIAATSSRLMGLMFGAEDFGLDLGLSTNRQGESRELIYARSAMIVACAAAKVQSIDGVWPDIHDFEGLTRDALQARRLGFTGKSTFHPGQIDIINQTFSPSPEEVAFAQRVVQAFEEAEAAGNAAVALGGQLIDLPIVERARRVLKLHETLGQAGA